MKIQNVFLTIILGLGAVGCMAPEGPYVGVAKPGSPEAAGKPVVLLNYDLVRTLAVDQPVTVDKDAAGRLRIQVGLRNRTNDENLQLQAQTLWKDATGRVLYNQPGSETAWQTLTLSPNQTMYYSQTALTPEATQFLVRVRYTRPAK